jgi:hypothetical protein
LIMPAAPSGSNQVELKQTSVFCGVEDLEHLGAVGVGVFQDLLARQRRAGRVLAAGVADHAGEVADQEHHVVAEVLEVAQLVDQHGMAEVQVRRGRVKAGLDAQGAAGFQLVDELGLDQQFVGAALDQRQLGVDIDHGGLTRVDGRANFATLTRLFRPFAHPIAQKQRRNFSASPSPPKPSPRAFLGRRRRGGGFAVQHGRRPRHGQ